MRGYLFKTVIGVAVFAVSSSAGGKGVIPAVTPVAPITVPLSFYIGTGVVQAKLWGCPMDDCTYEDVTYGLFAMRVGYDHNDYIGAEIRGFTTFLDEGPYGGTPLEHIGLYLKPQYPLGYGFNLYGLLGYGYTKNNGYGARLNYFDEGDGIAAGAGLEWKIPATNWSLYADFERLLIDPDISSLDAGTVGVRYDF